MNRADYSEMEGWISLQTYLESAVQKLKGSGIEDHVCYETLISAKKTEENAKSAQGQLLSEYINRLITNATVKQVSTELGTDVLTYAYQHVIDCYGDEFECMNAIELFLVDVCLSVITKGYAIFLRKEDDPIKMKRPIQDSCWYEYMQKQGATNHDTESESDDEHVKKEEQPEGVRKGYAYLSNKMDWKKVHKAKILPTYSLANHLAPYVYASRFCDQMLVCEKDIEAQYGIKDSRYRICVVGFNGFETMPTGIYIATAVVASEVIASAVVSRAVQGSTYTMSLQPSSYEAMSQQLGVEKEFLATASNLDGANGVIKANEKLIELNRSKMESLLASIPSSEKARIKVALAPPGCAGTMVSNLQIDPMSHVMLNYFMSLIKRGLGAMASSDSLKHKRSEMEASSDLKSLLAISTHKMIELIKAMKTCLGVSVPAELYRTLSPSKRLEQLLHEAVLAAVASKAADGKYLKAEDILDEALEDKDDDLSNDESVKKRKKPSEDGGQ